MTVFCRGNERQGNAIRNCGSTDRNQGGIDIAADLQKAAFWKRAAAWLFDGILTAVLAVGVSFFVSMALGYDSYSETVAEAYVKYETEYGVEFDITSEAYEALSDEEKQRYDDAYQALIADEDAVYAYNMSVNLSVIITTVSVLIAVMVWEFALPLVFRNGQTLGKKIFGLCLMKTNGVKVNHIQLLIRTLLGKFAVEIMIPVYAVLMLLWGTLNIVILGIIAVLAIAQVVLFIATWTNSAIHDLLAGTVVVDAQSQMIFDTEEALLAFKKQRHAEESAKQSY